ncbi:MAG TPA: CHAT domain-containing tetratricopeptide repeat protein [Pyrinomonadaceae bacterium]|nr:CHAT domain-containing tetratricopeptide repeat protein [Pyrinomonadaceae bacterium]
MRLRPVLLLAICFVWPCVRLQAQESAKAQIDEDDARLTSVAQRKEAVANLLTTGNQFRDAGDALNAARAWNRAGRIQLQLIQPDDAIVTHHNALQILRQTSDPQTRVDNLNGLANIYKYLNKCDKAAPLLNQAIRLSEQSAYVEGRAEALTISSYCQVDMLLALQMAEESLRLWQSVNNKVGTIRAYFAVGEFQMIQNNLDESRQSYENAAKLAQELNLPTYVAEATINLGFIEYRKGDRQAPVSFYTQAESLIDEEAEPYMMGQLRAGLAETFIESGLVETGLAKYREALDYYLLTKMPVTWIGMHCLIGRAHYIQHHYSEAIAMLNESRAEAESGKYATVQGLSEEFLGRSYYELNDYPAALQHYEAALEVYGVSKNRMEAARVIALMGRVYQEQGDFKKAESHYQKALASFQKLSDQVNESATLYALGTLALKRNQLDAAEKYLHDCIKITEAMRRVSTSVDLTAAFSARVHERYEKYIDCLMRRYQASQSENLNLEAFTTSELERARALIELLYATQANVFPDLDPAIALKEKQLRESLQIIENAKVKVLSTKYRKEEIQALEARHQQLEADHDRLLTEIEARNPGYAQKIRPTAWELPKIQQQVIRDDDTVLLEYSLGSEKSYLWTVTRAGLNVYELPDEEKIGKVASRVRELLKITPSANIDAELTTTAQELAQMILWPAAKELNRSRIIVVADGILNYIPFQILPSTAGNEPLVARSEIVNAPSASILGVLQLEAAQRQPAANLLAAFGDPVFAANDAETKQGKNGESVLAQARLRSALRDTQFNSEGTFSISRLFYAKQELDSLRQVAGEKALIITDYAATREQFLKTDLTQYSMLHLVTHGYFDPKEPESSGFLLSTVDRNGRPLQGFIGLKDIYELRAPLLLVVLSACQSALGDDVRGEGLLGVTRGFMYAGASSVVASLWQVDDEATAELMRLFYSNMLEHGMKPGEALRAAQNSIRERPDRPDWHSPYFWAAFTIQGEYDQIIKPQPRGLALRWKVLIAVALLMTMTAGLWYGRRRRLRKSAS